MHEGLAPKNERGMQARTSREKKNVRTRSIIIIIVMPHVCCTRCVLLLFYIVCIASRMAFTGAAVRSGKMSPHQMSSRGVTDRGAPKERGTGLEDNEWRRVHRPARRVEMDGMDQ